MTSSMQQGDQYTVDGSAPVRSLCVHVSCYPKQTANQVFLRMGFMCVPWTPPQRSAWYHTQSRVTDYKRVKRYSRELAIDPALCWDHLTGVFSRCLGNEDWCPLRFGITDFSFVVEGWWWTDAGTRICCPTQSGLFRLPPVHRRDASSGKPSTVWPPPRCWNRIPDSRIQHSLQSFAGDAAQECTQRWRAGTVHRRQGRGSFFLFCWVILYVQ